MGCDIHMFLEIRKNGKWKYQPSGETYPSGNDQPFYDVRNYNIFAILAGVRNGAGSLVVIRATVSDR